MFTSCLHYHYPHSTGPFVVTLEAGFHCSASILILNSRIASNCGHCSEYVVRINTDAMACTTPKTVEKRHQTSLYSFMEANKQNTDLRNHWYINKVRFGFRYKRMQERELRRLP